MISDNSTLFAKLYHSLCLLAAIGLVSWCISEYRLDNDVTQIMLRRFHETVDDIHPSITLCDKNPFGSFDTSATIDGGDVPLQKYGLLIKGDKSAFEELRDALDNDTMFDKYMDTLNKVDYDDVTAKLRDTITHFDIKVPIHAELIDVLTYNVKENMLVINRNESKSEIADLDDFQYVNTFVSSRHPNYKCFTFDVPMKEGIEIREIKMRLNTSGHAGRPNLSQFYFMLTYPRQILGVSRGNQVFLDRHHKGAQCYTFEVVLGSIEVFKRRDKSRQRCNVDWRHHDAMILHDIMDEVGCNPKHWKVKSNLPKCFKVDEYRKINQKMDEMNMVMPPCRRIEKVSKITKGKDLGWRCLRNSYLDLKFIMDEERFYKEIVLFPAYTFQSLVGNSGMYMLVRQDKLYFIYCNHNDNYNFYICNHYTLILGGYIGLFIGYTIAQAPELAIQLMRFAVETFKYLFNHTFK